MVGFLATLVDADGGRELVLRAYRAIAAGTRHEESFEKCVSQTSHYTCEVVSHALQELSTDAVRDFCQGAQVHEIIWSPIAYIIRQGDVRVNGKIVHS